MKFNYQSHANKPGIYKILNTHSNRIYIGQAARFERRWYDHKRSLVANKHQNKFLRHDFAKCKAELGHDDFLEFHVLEVMEGSTKEERNLREEFYINSVWDQQEFCYNFKQKVQGKERSCYSLTPEETSKKISDASKKSRARPEVKAKQVERMERQWAEDGRKEAWSERMIKQWSEPGRKESYGKKIQAVWEDPDKRAELIERRKNNPELIALFRKNCHTPEALAKMAAKQTKNHGKIISPTGEVFEVIGLKAFCLEHGIPESSLENLHHVLIGKYPSCFGWRKYSEELVGKEFVANKGDSHCNARSFTIVSPDGALHEGHCITTFCQEHELRKENITAVVNGRRKSHKGWHLPRTS